MNHKFQFSDNFMDITCLNLNLICLITWRKTNPTSRQRGIGGWVKTIEKENRNGLRARSREMSK